MPGHTDEMPEIWRLAAGQHGLVTRAQLVDVGFTRSAIAHGLRTRRLWRVHRAVFAVGRSQLTQEGAWLAAVLACGEATLSHLAAASLWGLRESAPRRPQVSVPTDAGRRGLPGIDLHRVRTLRTDDATRRAGVPVTTLPRTLVDLAGMLDAKQLKSVLRQSERQHGLDLARLRKTLDECSRHSHRHARLRRLLDAYVVGSSVTESELEAGFLELCVEHRLPIPESQAAVGRYRADFLWRDLRLVVEVDGREFHGGFISFRDHRVRDRAMKDAGLDVLRFTGAEVLREGESVARELSATIRRRTAGALRTP